MSIRDNIVLIRKRIEAAALRANRNPEDVQLMAVSKTQPADRIREAYEAGQRLFGENRVQEFQTKHAELAAASPTAASAQVCDVFDIERAEFHLIGHLQSNKSAKAAEIFAAVDSVDSMYLADRLNQAAEKLDKKLRLLIEINIGGEEAKTGFAPDAEELIQLLGRRKEMKHIEIRGLMTVPPFTESPEGARKYFRELRKLRDELAARMNMNLPELSMGMSHDFEIAVEEGSTCVRVGTAIFGARDYSK
jgi:pyridoxal phosphate enzyme (YggS family)